MVRTYFGPKMPEGAFRGWSGGERGARAGRAWRGGERRARGAGPTSRPPPLFLFFPGRTGRPVPPPSAPAQPLPGPCMVRPDHHLGSTGRGVWGGGAWWVGNSLQTRGSDRFAARAPRARARAPLPPLLSRPSFSIRRRLISTPTSSLSPRAHPFRLSRPNQN